MTSQAIEFYTKDIGNWQRVFDFQKLYESKWPFIVLISDYGVWGKSYGAKELITQLHYENGYKAVWLRNLESDINKEKNRFLAELPENMAGVSWLKAGSEIILGDKDKVPYVYLKSLNGAEGETGNRRPAEIIIYDEANRETNQVRGEIMDRYFLLANRFSKPKNQEWLSKQKHFLLCNNKGLNHPFFLENGIAYLPNEVNEFYDLNGNPLILVIRPKSDNQRRKKIQNENLNNPLFQMAEATGHSEHMYYNMSDDDEVNGVYKYFDISVKGLLTNPNNFWDNGLELLLTLKQGKDYLNVYAIKDEYQNPLETSYHIVNLSLLQREMKREKLWPKDLKIEELLLGDDEGHYLVLVSSNQRVGEVLCPTQTLNDFKTDLGNNKISFENTQSRQSFYNFLLKKK